MKDFFGEYGWFMVAGIGAVLGFNLFWSLTMGSDPLIAPMIRSFLGGLM